jgi:hypothetical protein
MNIDFISSQITDTNGYVVYSGRDRTMNNQPFFIAPVIEGYGNMCVTFRRIRFLNLRQQ